MSKEERDRIRIKLFTHNLSHTWLIARLAEDGIVTDKSELSGALSGARTGKKIEEIIKAALEILDEYESRYANARK